MSVAAQTRAHTHAQIGDQVERAVGAPHHGLHQADRQGALGQQATGERGLGMHVEAPVRQFDPGSEKSQHNRGGSGKHRVSSHNDQLGSPAPGAQGQPAPGHDHPQRISQPSRKGFLAEAGPPDAAVAHALIGV